MKKIIRLTESDLIRIVNRVIKESEEPEEKLKRFENLGFDPIQSYFLALLNDETTWEDLFTMYGESVMDSFFENNPDNLMEFVLYSLGAKFEYKKDYKHLPKFEYDSYEGLKNIFKNFFNLDLDYYLLNRPQYSRPFVLSLLDHGYV